MNEKFFDLKKEKQDRMINAALKIFGMRGYQFASTDDIVKEAGISKGLLFHYFGSKSGLYSFIYDYSVRFMSMELKASVDANETNFFTLQKQIETGRLQVLKNYPCMQLFLEKCNVETTKEALLAVEEKKEELAALYDSFNAQIDFSLLPEGTDTAKLQNMLRYTLKNLMEEQFLLGSLQPEMLYQENTSYITFLENLFAKKA
ncbi:MAG: TetR/AcrR family transcriptional regulator [Lachnospiraceae bacterium]|nr:TetR/AcrR family transcriptional regulator [Lachnospiraceae bacterium]